MPFKRPWLFAVLSVIGSMLILQSCNSLQKTPDLGTPTTKTKEACVIFSIIKDSRGKPGNITTEEVAALLDRDDPIARVRNLTGDTMKTRAQIAEHNAAWRCYCEGVCNVEVTN